MATNFLDNIKTLAPKRTKANGFINIIRDIRGDAKDLILAAQDPDCIYGELVIKYNDFVVKYDEVSADIASVADITTEIVTVSGISDEVLSLYADKVTLDRLFMSIDNIDRVHQSINSVDRLSLSDTPDNIDRLGDVQTSESIDILGNIITAAALDRLNTGNTADNIDRLGDITTSTALDNLSSNSADLAALSGNSADLAALSGNSGNLELLGTPEVISDMDILAHTEVVADMETVADISTDVTTLSGINLELSSLYADKDKLDSLFNDKATLDSLYADKATLDSLFNDKTRLDSLFNDKATLDSLYADKATIDSIFSDKTTLDSLFNDKTKLDSLYADKATLDSLFNDKSTLDSLYTDKESLDSLFNDKATLDRLVASITNIDRIFSSISNVDVVALDLLKGIGTNQSTDSAILNALTNANQTISDAAKVAADLAQTTLDRAKVAADLETTNQNVVTTTADKVQTGIDRAEVASDLAKTHQDTIDTAADLAQTTLDRAAVAADLLLTHQDTIDTAADAAQTTQDRLSTAADLAKTHQDTIDTAADLAQTTLDRAATNQDAIDTAADVVVTNADVVITTADKAAAASSAVAAQTAQGLSEDARDASEISKVASGVSADTSKSWATHTVDVPVPDGNGDEYSAKHWAYKSAQAALGSLKYKGSWDATTEFPDSPALGDYYKVSVAGPESASPFTYNSGDSIIYNGSTWDHVDSSDAVNSVDGQIGSVNLSNVYEPKNSNIQAHVSSSSNPHGVTKAQVGLGLVDNTSDSSKSVSYASSAGTSAALTGAQADAIVANTAKVTNVTTNLSKTVTATDVTINSSDGTDVAIGAASSSNAGVMTSADKSKLNGIESGATGDQTKADIDALGINAATVTSGVYTNSKQALHATDALRVSGTTVSLYKGDGTSESITTQDTNTWRSISDSISSTSTTVSASSKAVKAAYDRVWSTAPNDAQKNVATNLSWTAGTTAGPRVNSSTGADSVIPSASASASGVVTTGSQTFAGNKTLAGGLTINGSLTSGGITTASQYHSGADNIILGGNENGISSIFFKSEKDGTNINHTSDFGFIQFHSYGTSTSGEANELIIGVSNDSDDNVILNAPNINGIKMRAGASEADHTVYHTGNIPTWNQNTTGNAATATKLSTAKTISLSGDASGSITFDGSASKTLSVVVNNDSHTHDGRYYTESEINSKYPNGVISTKSATVGGGWMTVATSYGSRHSGKVVVSDQDNGDHAYIEIDWMRSYSDSNFTVLNVGGYRNRITGVRVLYETSDSVYKDKRLQVYVTASSTYTVKIYGNNAGSGWGNHSGITPIIENTKSGFAVHKQTVSNLESCSLAAQEGIATGGLLRFVGTPDGSTDNQGIYWDAHDKENVGDYSDYAHIKQVVNTGGLSGTVLEIRQSNDTNDGVLVVTASSTGFKHNSNTVWTSGNDGSGSGLDADLLDGQQGSSFLRSNENDTAEGNITFSKKIAVDWIDTRSGNGMIVTAGESRGVQSDAGSVNGDRKVINLISESGLRLNSSPDNWANGWGTRWSADILDNSGLSSFPQTGLRVARTTTAQSGNVGNQYVVLDQDGRWSTSPALTSFSNVGNAKNLIIESTTNSSNNAPTSGSVGVMFKVRAQDKLIINENGLRIPINTNANIGNSLLNATSNITGSNILTANRHKYGNRGYLYNTATGGTLDNGKRLYLYGSQGYVRTNHASGSVYTVKGAFNIGKTTGAGAVSEVTGSTNLGIAGGDNGNAKYVYGSYNKAYTEDTTGSTNNITHAKAVYAKVEHNSDNGVITNALAVQAHIDNNEQAGDITNGYLFHGYYEGPLPTNNWGVYISSNTPNYFRGDVVIGGTSASSNSLKLYTNAIDFRNTNGNTATVDYADSSDVLMFSCSDSRFTGTVSTTALTETSDERVKTNIETIENPLKLVSGLRGVSYNNINTLDKDEIGLIAQEVRKVVPEIVTEDNEGMLSVSYSRTVAILVEGMKEQQKQINELIVRISTLEKEGV